jgi:hypothetical protein
MASTPISDHSSGLGFEERLISGPEENAT